MRTFRYDKLVRDDIITGMERDGTQAILRKLSDEEYKIELAKKLEEELDELEDGVGKNRERDLKELADVAELYETAWDILDRDEYYELFEAAMTELEKGIDMWEIDPEELLEAKMAKTEEYGAFRNRVYIEKVSIKEDNPWMQHYLEEPDKYPEVI